MEAFGVTDLGRKRKRNEDQFLIAELNKSILVDRTSLAQADHGRLMSGSQGGLLVVADGMGGHGGGDVASSVAVDSILNYVLHTMPWFFRLDISHEDDLRDELKSALQRSHASVRKAADARGIDPQMGTTLTMAYVIWPRLYVVHVGDSRCYLFRGSELERVTTDHTFAEQMVDKDVISREKASSSRWSNVLWNTVGGGPDEPTPDVYRSELELGDLLLLCPDGLTTHLNDDELRDYLRTTPESPEAIARGLVDRANEAGGSDNVTVVAARFD